MSIPLRHISANELCAHKIHFFLIFEKRALGGYFPRRLSLLVTRCPIFEVLVLEELSLGIHQKTSLLLCGLHGYIGGEMLLFVLPLSIFLFFFFFFFYHFMKKNRGRRRDLLFQRNNPLISPFLKRN